MILILKLFCYPYSPCILSANLLWYCLKQWLFSQIKLWVYVMLIDEHGSGSFLFGNLIQLATFFIHLKWHNFLDSVLMLIPWCFWILFISFTSAQSVCFILSVGRLFLCHISDSPYRVTIGSSSLCSYFVQGVIFVVIHICHVICLLPFWFSCEHYYQICC